MFKWILSIYKFSSVQSLSRVWFCATPWTTACQATLSITSTRSLLKLMSIESVMPSNHLTLCHPLLLLPSIFKTLQSLNLKFRGHQNHLEVLSDETAGSRLLAVAGSAVVLRLLVEGRPPGVPFLYRISHSLAGRRHLFPLQWSSRLHFRFFSSSSL